MFPQSGKEGGAVGIVSSEGSSPVISCHREALGLRSGVLGRERETLNAYKFNSPDSLIFDGLRALPGREIGRDCAASQCAMGACAQAWGPQHRHRGASDPIVSVRFPGASSHFARGVAARFAFRFSHAGGQGGLGSLGPEGTCPPAHVPTLRSAPAPLARRLR